ncbi:MAG: thioesterase family protein [Desulfuromonadales bacterium]|nr:thioesterase family protein [Desulfuromonadales bacterium]
MDFSAEIQVRFADLDAYGHVNHATFFTFLETARTLVFKKPFLELMHRRQLLMIVKAECRYLKPVTLNGRVIVKMQPEEIRRTSFALGYQVHDGQGTTFAEAKTVMVCFDERRGKPVAIPDEMKQALGLI